MKILFSSHLFAPSVGGIEEVSRLLAREFVSLGHDVHIITETASNQPDATPHAIVRNPAPKELLRLVKWCDVFFHNNVSLRVAWPLLFHRKPWVVAHHTWISRPDGKMAIVDHLKHFALRRARNIAISKAMAAGIRQPSTIIPDPYDATTFRQLASQDRRSDLIFVGRLVSDKGVDLLIESLAELKRRKRTPRLTVVGDGPELDSLRALAAHLGIQAQVTFAGKVTGEPLARLLNDHRILVVPSRWNEPFGIVALEGIACGCMVIGSTGGGLPEAIGPCGATFPNGDVAALTCALEQFLTDPHQLEGYRRHAEAHLQKHQPRAVAERYLQVFESALN